MQMTNEEIVRDYNAAANKNKQVNILAELNTVSPGEIRAVLAQAGVEGVDMPKRIRQSKPEREAPQGGAFSAKRAVGPPTAKVQESNPAVYQRIEMILDALPEDASKYTRDTAGDLVAALFKDYVRQRLRMDEKNES